MKTLGIDIGTTTMKCAIFENGRMGNCFGKEYPLYSKGKCVQQNADDWRRLIKEGVGTLGDLSGVSGVSISSQGITILPVDKNGVAMSYAISWLDTSAEEELEDVRQLFGEEFIYQKTGKPLSPYYSLPKIKKLVSSGVKAAKFLMPSDYIYFLFTGKYYTDYSMASGTMLFDIHTRTYHKELLKFCGIDEEQLPIPVEMGTKIGEITEEAAKEFGIPAGTPVIMGAQDQKISAYACALDDTTASVSIGTSTAISFLKETKRQLPAFAYNNKDLIYEAALNTTGAAIRWLKNLMFSDYEEMDRVAREAGGNGGIIFQSDFTDGPSIQHFNLASTKGEIVNALYEDIAKRISAFLPDEVSKLILFGGGAKSKWLCETIARATGCGIHIPDSVEIALAGADKLVCDFYKEETLC